MSRYLLDTGIAQEVNRRNGVPEQVLAVRRRANRIGNCTPVPGELWSGVEGSTSRERNLHRLRLALSRLVVWPYTNEAAERFGQIFAELRRIGRPMQQIDIMVASIALSLGDCTVVPKDADLSAVPGLRVENWATLDA
jgi:tRNA(fMet)-specific endonuclease VapC